MIALRIKKNHAHYDVTAATTRQTVPVRLRSGEYRFPYWGGYIDRFAAGSVPGAIPVKIAALAYTVEYDIARCKWTRLEDNVEFVQGCFIQTERMHGGIVLCVMEEGAPRIVHG
jgi:hypothetical protein